MAVMLNKLVRSGSVAFMQFGGLGNGLLSCGRTIEPPHPLFAPCGVSLARFSAGVNPFPSPPWPNGD